MRNIRSMSEMEALDPNEDTGCAREHLHHLDEPGTECEICGRFARLKDFWGKKFDDGKTQYHLMPVTALETVNRVLMHGAQKYGDGNWRNVENAEQRYFNAAMRHMQAWLNNEETDPESGLPHLAYAVCSLMFLVEKESTQP